jgi:hypothetical protein
MSLDSAPVSLQATESVTIEEHPDVAESDLNESTESLRSSLVPIFIVHVGNFRRPVFSSNNTIWQVERRDRNVSYVGDGDAK